MGLSRSPCVLPAVWLALAVGTPETSPAQPAMLPPMAGGWARAESVGVFAGKDLFRLIDGGADLFFEYGFVRALSSEYTHPPDASTAVELYEMKSAEAAYGLFTAFTVGTGTAVPIGQEAVLGDGYCIFWKGTVVGMLTTASFDSGAGALLLQLAGEVEKEIHHAGTLPHLCALLRAGGLEPQRMVFVRGRLALGNQLPQAWASSFPPAEGVVGTSGRCRYLVLEYADAAAARAALDGAAAEWKDLQLAAARDAGGNWMIQERDERVTIVARQGRYVLAVSGGADEPEALKSLLERVLEGS